MLTTDPDAFAQWLQRARPTPVSDDEKTRILLSLPEDGEVTDLKPADLKKLAGLRRVLQAVDRDLVYVVKVVDVPQAAVGLHGRTVVLISKAALGLVNTDELQALVAHEMGHEYVWDDYATAVRLADGNRVKGLELMCDAIAVFTLTQLGMDSSRLISSIEKISRFNRDRFGTAMNEHNYPTVGERRAFARSIGQWLTRRDGSS